MQTNNSPLFNQIAGSLIVAGILGLVAFAWRISIQVEGFHSDIQVIQGDVVRNRKVMCALAKKQEMFVSECLQ